MKTQLIVIAAVIGTLIGTAAYAACSETFDFEAPCQNTSGQKCPTGCTTTYYGISKSDCVLAANGCCQWRIREFVCSGGSCGSGCAHVTAPNEFTGHYPLWVCCEKSNDEKWCRPACVGDPGEGG